MSRYFIVLILNTSQSIHHGIIRISSKCLVDYFVPKRFVKITPIRKGTYVLNFQKTFQKLYVVENKNYIDEKQYYFKKLQLNFL